MSRKRSRAQRGFGLIELVIVVAIIAILASIASASFARAKQQSTHRQNAQRVASAVKEARALARSRRTGFPGWADGDRVVRAGVRFGTGTAIIFVDSNAVDDGAPSAVDVDLVILDVDQGMSMQGPPPPVVFDGNGLLRGTNDVDLAVRDTTSGDDHVVRVRHGGQVEML
jgi:type II secretion system protein H